MKYYPYRFVQNFNDENISLLKHKKLYTFKSSKSNLWYWVWVECYEYDIYAVKFHLKSLRNSPYKYRLLTNTFEPRTITNTCIQIMLDIFRANRKASFGFIGSNLLGEEITSTKRFRFYSRIMATYFTEKHFIHQEDKLKSTYLLINREELSLNPHLILNIQDAFTELYDYFE